MSVTAAQSQLSPTASDADPETLGWMQGFPPPPDKTITFHDGSFRSFPNCAGRGPTFASWCRP
jgi:hypothetical protein